MPGCQEGHSKNQVFEKNLVFFHEGGDANGETQNLCCGSL